MVVGGVRLREERKGGETAPRVRTRRTGFNNGLAEAEAIIAATQISIRDEERRLKL